MAFDFEVVKNVNEFYSDHFLESLFEGEFVKGLIAKWDQEEEETGRKGPHRRLGAIGGDLFKAKARFAQTQRDEDRLVETHRINVAISEALDYPVRQGHFELVDGGDGKGQRAIPVLASVNRSGNPYLWITESWFLDENESLLDRKPVADQISPEVRSQYLFSNDTWESIFSAAFARDEPPRWILMLAGNRAMLVERHKWGQGKYLLFDIERALDTRQEAVRLVATFISKDALAPEGAAVLHDQIDEKSHKHAFAVSEDLKDGLRKAVELLANEAITYRRVVRKEATLSDGDALAQTLKEECLRFLYRLLFLFYAEARGGELGIIPMNSDEYREGYSLETLRDLELVALNTSEAQDGYYIDDSLRLLFRIVNDGFAPLGDRQLVDGATFSAGFTIKGLHSPLFDMRKTTPTLAGCRFRNVVMQQVLQLLSLSKGDKKKGRGRISYSQLGINQLGAVYEGILSYSGFFAKETLYEVRAIGSKEGDQSYFVPESEIAEYDPEEFVKDPDPRNEQNKVRRKYEKGTFIFRLAGRDRTSSASYYTPEVLTKCVVKYSLKELLNPRERDPLTAKEILELTVLEPAVGSGAFLNEAVNQLADAYLERRQKELGETIPASEYAYERQRVKAYMAANNCYGVDLNPIASDLAKVSLWLNTLYRDSPTPWYGLRIAEGNSLIGCRRQVWSAKDVRDGSYRKKVPTRLALGPEWEPRPKDGIYHFLLPDDGMCDYGGDKVVRDLAKEQIETIKTWKKAFVSAKFDDDDVRRLCDLSGRIDELWQDVIKERREAASRCHLPLAVWGMPQEPGSAREPEAQENIAAELELNWKASRRLKLLMDYWCSLWFWPVEQADKLPTRDVWLLDLETVLRGTTRGIHETQSRFEYGGNYTREDKDYFNRQGYIDVDALTASVERLRIAAEVAQSLRFHHWELRFADLYADHGGFDLILGNPPWVKIEWNEGLMLADYEPVVALRDLSAIEVAERRVELLRRRSLLSEYLAEFAAMTGSKAFFNAVQAYPFLQGVQTNLYKLFIERSWSNGSKFAIIALLHPEGVFDDPSGGPFRKPLYRRLRRHFQFHNEMSLFPDVGHTRKYSINVYSSSPQEAVSFASVSNLYLPVTIDESFNHDGSGTVPSLKTQDNHWEIRGHSSRILHFDQTTLSVLAEYLGLSQDAWIESPLFPLHSQEFIPFYRSLLLIGRRLGDASASYHATTMFHETNRQADHTIRRETRYPVSPSDIVFQGPHVHVGTCIYQTPNERCKGPLDYSKIDIPTIPVDYLPRTNYVRECSEAAYVNRIGSWKGESIADAYRYVHRATVDPKADRSLKPAIIPPKAAHLYKLLGVNFSDIGDLLTVSGLCSSLPYDAITKASGVSELNTGFFSSLPYPRMSSALRIEIVSRVLRLNCATVHFKDLYESAHAAGLLGESATATWRKSDMLLFDLDRERALAELDALGGIALGLTAAVVIALYNTLFPTLVKNDRANRFDANGRQVPTAVLKFAMSLGIPLDAAVNPRHVGDAGAGSKSGVREVVWRNSKASNLSSHMDEPYLVLTDHSELGMVGAIAWTDPKLEPRREREYVPPFVRFDREADMRAAYKRFAHLVEPQEART